MKDTLIIGSFIAAVVGFWFYLQKVELPASSTLNASLQQQHSIENKNETGNQRYTPKSTPAGAIEGNSGRPTETEGLPSIYSRKRQQEPAPVVSHHKKRSKSAKLHAQRASKKARTEGPKMVHGVPLNQWIEWNQNNLRLGEVAGPQDDSVRFYVQCLEIRKGKPQSVAQGECKRLTSMPQNFAGVH